MAMSSGLEFNEDYGDVTDVTRMLYLEPDMAAYAAAQAARPARSEAFFLFERDDADAVAVSGRTGSATEAR